MTTKKIGYVDFELENFHSNIYLQILRGELADRGFEIAGATSMNHASGKEWADKNNVPYFEDIADLNEQIDYFAVLSPSNPERHFFLCEQVFPFKKTTYVDKTFAPDYATAKRIFDLADLHGTTIQTTSALRYTDVQEFVKQNGGQEAVRHITAWGGGASFNEYSVHPLEVVISCMGPEIESVMRRGDEPFSQLLLNFSGGRTATVNVYTNHETDFAATVTTAEKTVHIPIDGSRIFVDMAAAMLDFFESGTPNIDRAESLAIRLIQDTAKTSEAFEKPVSVKG